MKIEEKFDNLIFDIKDKAKLVDKFIFDHLKYDNNDKLSKLYESSFHYIKSGGKRIRPYLLIKSYQLFGVNENLALPTAATIEMIHNFSLIHDDIMDNSDFRRNVEAVHKKYGLDYGILSGDFLIFYALNFLITKNINLGFNKDKVLAINNKIIETCIEICEGQALDLEFSKKNTLPSKEEYFLMVSKKTAALFSSSCYLGGFIAEVSYRDLEKLSNYGKYIGISFQIIDDLLGILGESEKMGKPVGSDIIEGKKTIPIILACEIGGENIKQKIISIINLKNKKPKDISFIVETMRDLSIDSKLKDLAKRYSNMAINEISNLEGDIEVKKYLIELANFIVERDF